MKHTDRRRLPIGALAVSALLLAGCGEGGNGGDDGATGGTASPTVDATATTGPESPTATGSPAATGSPTGTESPTGTASPSGTASPTGDGGDEATTVAGVIAAAVETVPGSQAFELDRKDDGGWEVKVAADDREQEVDVSEDGSEATPQPGGDELDDEDRRNLAQVAVPLEVAVRTALQEVEGTLDDAELGTEGGTVVWEIDIDDADGASVDVYVNVGDGSVLKVDR